MKRKDLQNKFSAYCLKCNVNAKFDTTRTVTQQHFQHLTYNHNKQTLSEQQQKKEATFTNSKRLFNTLSSSKLLHGTVPKSKAEMSSSSLPGDSCPSAMASNALLRTAAWTSAASMELKGGAVGGVVQVSKWVWRIPWWIIRMKITKSKNGDFRFRRIEIGSV